MIRIYKNTSDKRFGHGKLPMPHYWRIMGKWYGRKYMHLLWLGPIFIQYIPR